jgi:3-hydroxyacyl-CoA dehydrogenase
MGQKIGKVGIVGTGTIGSSWAALFAAHGLDVRMYDVNAEALAAGLSKALVALNGLFPDCDETDAELCSARKRIRAVATPSEALSGADFIQESVLERYPIKREAHDLIERHAPAGAIIASSSSGLLANKMQDGLVHPERFVVAHPFNPPHLIPLVELVPGPKSSEAVMRATHEFYTALGKVPVVLRKEVPGHIANRLAVAVWREAINLVADGVASIEDVDKALYAGPGLRWAAMGQHMIYHLNGGPKGYEGFIEHFGPQIEGWLEDMARWTRIPEDARREVLRQMDESIKGRTMEDLEACRDERLKKVLEALYPREEAATTTVR